MAASTIYSAEYDLVFYPGGDPTLKEYSLTYTIPDVPDTIEGELFDKVDAFNKQSGGYVKERYTYPANDLPINTDAPMFSHIKEARLIETIRTPIE